MLSFTRRREAAFGHKPHLRSNPDLFLSRHALSSDVGELGGTDVGTFLYRCPATGLNVQGLGADHPDAPNDNVYEAVTCTFCRGVHLVNPKTGRVAGANANTRRSR